jgi:hypothetical protein
MGLPVGCLIGEAVGQFGLALPLLGFETRFAFGLGRNRIVELGIKEQTGDQPHAVLSAGVPEADGGESAISDEHQFARGMPLAHEPDEHLGILWGSPVGLPKLLAQCGRAGWNGQDGHRPLASTPRTGDQ